MNPSELIPELIPELRVNTQRLRADIDALAQIGRHEDQGIYRMAFSEGDMAGRDWLRQRISESGFALCQGGEQQSTIGQRF